MPEAYKDIENRIQQALDTIKRDEKPNIANIAREFRTMLL
jgi:hypothetical protein